jgi:carbamoyltransferase
MNVLGINLSHDRSAALLQDGKIVVAIAEERLDRIKHSLGNLYWTKEKLGPKALPWLSISYCLKAAKIGLDDLDLIVVDHAFTPADINSLRSQIPIKNPEKIVSINHPSHHLAHAYSTYFCSSFDESAILVMDHIGSLVSLREKESETTFYAKDFEISLVQRYLTGGRDLEEDSESPANLYRLVTLLLGFVNPQIDFGQKGKWLAQYDDAGKTMGLAPYGVPRKDWEDWVQTDSAGDPCYINFVEWLKKHKLLKVSKVLSGNAGDDLKLLIPQARKWAEPLKKIHKDLAYKAQEELEKAILILTKKLHQETGSTNLCMAGGISLNSVANKMILDQGLFKNLFIQPASTDDGNAIGAAMYGYFALSGGKKRAGLTNVFLGRNYSDEEIETSLKRLSLHQIEKFDDSKALTTFIAQEIAAGKVVAWYRGGSEFGPRALGNRSILADPRQPWMKDHLNAKVKFRESFRPYAPVVLKEHASKYFEFDGESPFMLMVAPVRPEKKETLPAITHIDGTARLQTLKREDNPLYYDLISKFGEITGVPILLNTSFNVKGYPIVETPTDAIWSFFNSEMDYLVMNNYLVKRELYSDRDIVGQTPISVLRIEKDYSKPPRYFIYDSARQETVVLTDLDNAILSQCNGSQQISDILKLQLAEEKEILNKIRTYLRNQWIVFMPAT